MDDEGDQHNSVMEMNTRLVPPGKMNLYSNAFVVEHKLLAKEKDGQRSVNYESNRNWHIMNNAKHNSLGQHTGYMLMTGVQAKPFMDPGSMIRKKAGFLDHQLWITQYQEDEIFPAGKYPGSNKVYDGLPQWTAKNRAIDNNDIVLWYVAGITHIVRPEEWPVMPCHHMGFTLMPFGFFSSNPTMGMANPEFLKEMFPEAVQQPENKNTPMQHQ
jgi:primary-amine oxidase